MWSGGGASFCSNCAQSSRRLQVRTGASERGSGDKGLCLLCNPARLNRLWRECAVLLVFSACQLAAYAFA